MTLISFNVVKEKKVNNFFHLATNVRIRKILNVKKKISTISDVEGVMSVNTAREKENLSLSHDKTKKKSFISEPPQNSPSFLLKKNNFFIIMLIFF